MVTKLVAYNQFPENEHVGNILPLFMYYFRTLLPTLAMESDKAIGNTGVSHSLMDEHTHVWKTSFVQGDREVIWEETLETFPDDLLKVPEVAQSIKAVIKRRGYENFELHYRVDELHQAAEETYNALTRE